MSYRNDALETLAEHIDKYAVMADDARRQAEAWRKLRDEFTLRFYEEKYGIKVGSVVLHENEPRVVTCVHAHQYPERPNVSVAAAPQNTSHHSGHDYIGEQWEVVS